VRILGFEICSYKRIVFGDLVARQFVIFEHKRLFGIIVFHFSGGEQDRFHTHAFNALSIKLFGSYVEGKLDRRTGAVTYERRASLLKYFPRDSYHSINRSEGCCTVLIQGPWKKTWLEYKDGVERVLTWHRKELE
jgi:hypothetical protein